MKTLLTTLLGATLLFGAGTAAAADYPTKPIRLIVPFSPGGAADLIGRLYGRYLETELRQSVVVENRPGAGGNIGITAVAKAEPDGHMIGLVANGILAINPYVFKQMPFDPQKDIIPIAAIASTPAVVTVNLGLPANTLKEFIEYARKNPGKVNYGSAGQGSTTHLAGAQLAQMIGAEMTHVPYKGAAPAVVDLVAGSVQMVAGPPPNVVPLIKSGKLRPLAVTSPKRSKLLPDVPTSAEAGLPGYEPITWYAIVAPAGIPTPVAERLHALTLAFVNSEAGNKALEDAMLDPMKMSQRELVAFIKGEMTVMEKVVKATGMKAE